MNDEDLRQLIKDTLTPLNLYSKDVEELLIFTSATESHCGEYRHQENGPALGIFQMEPASHNDLWLNFICYHKTLADAYTENVANLQFDDHYAIFMARCQYLRHSDPIPNSGDVDAIWACYKKLWNTELGAAIQSQSIECYRKYGQC